MSVIENLKKESVSVFAIEQVENSIFLQDFKLEKNKKYALVFGNETFGISDGIKRYIDGYFTIPQVGIIKSLNISVACAVTLYEAFRQKTNKGHYEKNKMSHEVRNALEEKWKMPK